MGEKSKPDAREEHASAAATAQHGFTEVRHYVPQELLDVSFPAAVRGYDRGAVDAYVQRVNRVIAELKVRASPPAAVRHALEQAEDKVQGLLRAAREAAQEITASAQREAEESTARAKDDAVKLVVNATDEAERVKAEAEELTATARTDADVTVAKAHTEADELLVKAKGEAESIVAGARAEADERLQRSQAEVAALQEQAETRLRELQADTDAVWQQRGELLEDIRTLAGGLVGMADAAVARLPREQVGPEDEVREPEPGGESGFVEDSSNESREPVPAAGSDGEGGRAARG